MKAIREMFQEAIKSDRYTVIEFYCSGAGNIKLEVLPDADKPDEPTVALSEPIGTMFCHTEVRLNGLANWGYVFGRRIHILLPFKDMTDFKCPMTNQPQKQ